MENLEKKKLFLNFYKFHCPALAMHCPARAGRAGLCGEPWAALRPVPTGPISRRPTRIVGRFPSADSWGFKILNMFDRDSRPTITESVE